MCEGILRKHLCISSRNWTDSKVIPTTTAKTETKQLVARRPIYKYFSLIMSNNFWYLPFAAVSGSFVWKIPVVGDVLSSHEQRISPNTFLDRNCNEFEFRTNRNYYVGLRQTFLSLKLTFDKGRVLETYKSKKIEKRNKSKKQWRLQWIMKRREMLQFPRLLILTAFCNQFFPLLRSRQTVSKFLTLMDCLLTNFFPTTSRKPSLDGTEACTVKGNTMTNALMILWTHLCLNPLSQVE